MSEEWLSTWFPLAGLLLQTTLWGVLVPRLVSEKTLALLTFQPSKTDPDF